MICESDDTPDGAARVVIYSRNECHLCDDARVIVERVCADRGERWREVDVDGDTELAQRYGDYVPVVLVDGVQQAFWRVDADRLAAAIDRKRSPSGTSGDQGGAAR